MRKRFDVALQAADPHEEGGMAAQLEAWKQGAARAGEAGCSVTAADYAGSTCPHPVMDSRVQMYARGSLPTGRASTAAAGTHGCHVVV